MIDPFERVAERRAWSRKAKVAVRAVDKVLEEREKLFKLWKKEQQKRRDELLKGPYSAAAQPLADFLERMTLEDASALFDIVKQGPWCSADADTRYQVLGMIDRAIIYVRECNGLAPIDDALPGEEPTVFELIYEMLQ